MKIAVFYNLPPGGAKRVVDEEIKYLSNKHEVKVFKLDINLYGNRLKKDFINFWVLARKHKKLAQKIDAGSFDVVLVHPDKLTQAPFVLKFLKTPTLYFCEELLRIVYEKELAFNEKVFVGKKIYEKLTRRIRKKIDKNNTLSATGICVASRYIQKKVQKEYNRRSVVCSLGVNANKFKPAVNPKRNYILFIGERDKIAGYSFVKKLSKLINKKMRIEVVSGFRLSDKELIHKYSNALVALCTSYNEPFGLISLESMACGTAVLAVNEGGYKETLINGKTGFLLKRDPEVFDRKVSYLIKHPNIAREMGKAGRIHVIKRFNWDKHNRALEKELTKLVK